MFTAGGGCLDLRVLMLSWEFPPRIIGGIATHVYHLSKALSSSGSSVHVITSDFPNTPPRETVNGVEVTRVDTTRISQKDFLLWIYYLNSQMIEAASKLLETERFDVLHAHDWMVGRAALELKNRHDLPLITTVHATEVGRGGRLSNAYQKKIHDMERLLVDYSEKVICCSSYMANQLRVNFAPPDQKVEVIPNGVDPSSFGAISPTGTGTEIDPAAEKVILFVGRLVQEKGLYILLEAFEELRRQNINARLVIVGEGPIRDDLVKKSLSDQIRDHVSMTGFVDHETLTSFYQSSHVFVAPSLYEPFGIVALEAMANGLPVVVSSTGGLDEIVENEVSGIKVQPGEPKALATAIRRILEDPGLAERLRQNAFRNIVEKHDWNDIAETTLESYGKLAPNSQSDVPISHEDYLSDPGLLQLLLTTGATESRSAKTAKQVADFVKAPEKALKTALGKHISRGYVSTKFTPEDAEVRYHLTETGIIRASAGFS